MSTKNIRLQIRFVGPHPNEMKAAVLALLPDIDLLVVWGTIGGVAAKAAMPNSDQAHDVAYWHQTDMPPRSPHVRC